jgi:hypothetical protein
MLQRKIPELVEPECDLQLRCTGYDERTIPNSASWTTFDLTSPLLFFHRKWVASSKTHNFCSTSTTPLPMSSLAVDIAHANNVAIGLMRDGKNGRASQLLSVALYNLNRRFFVRDNMTGSPNFSPTLSSDFACSARMEASYEGPGVASVSVTESDLHDTPRFDGNMSPCQHDLAFDPASTVHNDGLAFFCRGFIIPSTVNCLSTVEQGAVAVFVLFNCGLALHRHGLQTGKARFFCKALSLYSKAVALLEKYDFGDTQNGSLFVALLALYVNIAHVHSEFFNREAAQEALMSFYSSFSEICQFQVSVQEYSFFSLAAWLSQSLPAQHAPSA